MDRSRPSFSDAHVRRIMIFSASGALEPNKEHQFGALAVQVLIFFVRELERDMYKHEPNRAGQRQRTRARRAPKRAGTQGTKQGLSTAVSA